MIGSLRGTLLHRGATEVLIEVGGIGYRATATPATLAACGEVGGDTFVHVHHHVREDADTLYAFRTIEERLAFEALLGAHGVGPSLALAILSVHDPDALRRVLADDDVSALCLVPGVGKKTALRLLVELKERLAGGETSAPLATSSGPNGTGSARSEVREALAHLGYGPDEVRLAMQAIPDDGETSALLKLALQALAGAGAV